VNRLIIAAAGSGKTQMIVNEALEKENGRVLITTFTEANESEIKRKIIEKKGCVPANIHVQTWFSFLIEHGIRPYQSVMINERITGLLLVQQASAIGIPEAQVRTYFFDKSMQVYSDKIAKLACRIDEKTDHKIVNRIGKIYKAIYIDEIQDFAGYDLEFASALIDNGCELTMVGDPRQVTYHTHYERKNSKYLDGRIKDYFSEKYDDNILTIDETSLNCTHRNCNPICDFANLLYPNYTPCESDAVMPSDHAGVFFIKKEDVPAYIEKYKPKILRDSRRTKVYSESDAINFGLSKGLSFDRVLIYPTKPIVGWLQNHDAELKFSSRCKFYVAVTRARYSVAFVCDGSEFDGFDLYRP